MINKSRVLENSPRGRSSKTPSSCSGPNFKKVIDKVTKSSLRSHEKESGVRQPSSDSMDIELLEPAQTATRET